MPEHRRAKATQLGWTVQRKHASISQGKKSSVCYDTVAGAASFSLQSQVLRLIANCVCVGKLEAKRVVHAEGYNLFLLETDSTSQTRRTNDLSTRGLREKPDSMNQRETWNDLWRLGRRQSFG
eukprot:6455668-Amphidinium_carterae.2